ncbi:MAG: hypothetical protein H6736_18090 [Alphaproteobacteria bacterium]|nr:hypothetical protein [Alphaproteobacteria bacterium]MCB9693725.1 hypothetical protein [Alphaproteobacteria bacterium]
MRNSGLEALLRTLRRQPLTEEEQSGLILHLRELDAEVERLGAIAAAEREDVDWIERPVVRFGLWLSGTLAEREARERAEYDAAVAATLAMGDHARQMRVWLDSRREPGFVSDQKVVAELERLRPSDLAGLPEDGPELRALHQEIVLARDLQAIGRLCKQLGARAGLPHCTRTSLRKGFVRVRARLAAASQYDLVEQLANRPSETQEDRQALYDVRTELGRRAVAARSGAASALRDIVRRHHRPPGGWDAIDRELARLLPGPAQG